METKDLRSIYKKMKEKHPDYLILLRTIDGEFYECLKEDAVDVSKIIGIQLVDNGIKSVKFQHQYLDVYLPKLIHAGKKVALCDL